MKHVRAGLLEQMQLVSTELASAKQRNTKEVIEAQITIVYAAVDDQIERKEFRTWIRSIGVREIVSLMSDNRDALFASPPWFSSNSSA